MLADAGPDDDDDDPGGGVPGQDDQVAGDVVGAEGDDAAHGVGRGAVATREWSVLVGGGGGDDGVEGAGCGVVDVPADHDVR
jgi:hypothetical protein